MGCVSSRKGVLSHDGQLIASVHSKPEEGLEADYWFEIPLDNENLFPNLKLTKLPDLLAGRLFSTRMPRNLATSPAAKEDFKNKCKLHRLDVVLILTEKFEYDEYAKADIEAFYEDLGLSCMVYPIRDFSCPSERDFAQIVKRTTLCLADGKNVLVHCAGGNGRTGLILCGILKNCGVQNPIEHARTVKSTYVETPEQEQMVKDLPISVTEDIFLRHPTLAKIIAIDKLITAAMLKRKQRQHQQYQQYQQTMKRWSARRENLPNPLPRLRYRTKQRGHVVETPEEDQPPEVEEEKEEEEKEEGQEADEEDREVQERFKKKYNSTQLKELQQTFRYLDQKQDRKLSFNELRATLNGIGEDSYAKRRQLRTVVHTFGKEESSANQGRRQRLKKKLNRRRTIEFDEFADALMQQSNS